MIGLAYSLASYLVFLAVFVYFAAFTDGVLVPRHVDVGASGDPWTSAGIDLALIAAFGLQHSIMARRGFKRLLTRVLPARVERATFVLASSLVLALLMWQWRPLGSTVWTIENEPLAIALWTINVVGWVGVPISSLLIDHLELFGIRQAWHGFRRTTFERKGFVAPYLYRYVRHPMMLSLMVGLWVTPHMTVGHALLSFGMTIYVFVGVHFEERALAEELGLAYLQYKESTPRFLPIRLPKTPRQAPASGGSR